MKIIMDDKKKSRQNEWECGRWLEKTIKKTMKGWLKEKEEDTKGGRKSQGGMRGKRKNGDNEW